MNQSAITNIVCTVFALYICMQSLGSPSNTNPLATNRSKANQTRQEVLLQELSSPSPPRSRSNAHPTQLACLFWSNTPLCCNSPSAAKSACSGASPSAQRSPSPYSTTSCISIHTQHGHSCTFCRRSNAILPQLLLTLPADSTTEQAMHCHLPSLLCKHTGHSSTPKMQQISANQHSSSPLGRTNGTTSTRHAPHRARQNGSNNLHTVARIRACTQLYSMKRRTPQNVHSTLKCRRQQSSRPVCMHRITGSWTQQ